MDPPTGEELEGLGASGQPSQQEEGRRLAGSMGRLCQHTLPFHHQIHVPAEYGRVLNCRQLGDLGMVLRSQDLSFLICPATCSWGFSED